jgi:hydrogenase maturation factor
MCLTSEAERFTPCAIRLAADLLSALNEIAQSSDVGMVIDERSLSVRPEVRSACELLGLDPVYVAN